MNDLELYLQWQQKPCKWVCDMFNMKVQPLKPGYVIGDNVPLKDAKVDWFGKWEPGMITWQQYIVLLAVERALKRMAPKFISVSSGNGIGKAHKYDMVVPTPDGDRRWGDLKAGDKLFDEKGKPTTIIQTKHYRKIPMFRITFDDDSFCEVSSGHLWKVRGRQGRRKNTGWQILGTTELLKLGLHNPAGKRPCKQWEIPVQEPVMFNESFLELHPYVMGIWLSDGTKGEPMFTKPFPEIINKIRGLGYNVSGEKTQRIKGMKKIRGIFKKGVFKLGSYDRYIPDEYKFNTVEKRMDLLRGLCDGDGEVNHAGSIGYSTTSKRLADDVIWLVRSLGGKAQLQKTIKKGWYPDKSGVRIQCRDCYRITINIPFNPFTLEHRKTKYKTSTQRRYSVRWIKSIDSIPSEKGMCVTVSGESGLYLANDFIVTHNSTVISWLLLWGLFCFKGAQIPCTANTVQQLYDVLWKEVGIWRDRLPDWVKKKYVMEKDYVRFEDEPGSGRNWFARAATSKKENPEALSGVHSPTLVMPICDEASAVADEIFEIGESSMTNPNVLMILISNYTRLEGYFHRSQVNKNGFFQVLSFSGEDSPIVDPDTIVRALGGHGRESDYYRVHIKGLPPNEEIDVGDEWIPLITELNYTLDGSMAQPVVMGCDPGGEGRNKTAICVRDPFKAVPIGKWGQLKPMEILEKIDSTQKKHKIPDPNIILDGFGIGAEVLQAALTRKRYMEAVMVGEPASEKKMFANRKAEQYWRLREWLLNGGKLVGTDVDWAGLKKIFYRSDRAGRIEMMSKKLVVKRLIKDIDMAEALMLTFAKKDSQWTVTEEEGEKQEEQWDRFSLFN